ncbi:MAG: UDP-glucose 6-dehydrogenase, partial [Gemmatimonadetes bacterium]|nr:UDP-glucose 6-dehydrogenase [Gemmatimonadota bacterium]
MNVAVVGTGYVGLVAGACLAETGNRVTCVDIDERKVADLRRGEIPIYEPGLEEIVRRNVGAGRLVFTTELEGAVRSARVVFIAVGTPPDEDGSADLQHVLAVARTIGESMQGEKIVITKSTVPVGTA